MALLKLVKDAPGINFYEYRDIAYYGKYKYRVRFKLPCIRYASREKNVDGLLKRVNTQHEWKGIRKADRDTVALYLDCLTRFIDYRNTLKENNNGIIRVEFNTVAFFSNDLALLKLSEAINPHSEYDYTEAQVTTFVGVKTFVSEPKHKYRVYFKSKIIESDFVIQLYDLIKRSPEMHPSYSLKCWLRRYNTSLTHSWRYRFTNATHFIDYNDESTLSYLALMHGEFLGKRYKLEKRPEPG
jgi:hypothetical protein